MQVLLDVIVNGLLAEAKEKKSSLIDLFDIIQKLQDMDQLSPTIYSDSVPDDDYISYLEYDYAELNLQVQITFHLIRDAGVQGDWDYQIKNVCLSTGDNTFDIREEDLYNKYNNTFLLTHLEKTFKIGEKIEKIEETVERNELLA